MKDPEKLTKKERIDWTLLLDTMSMLEYDLLQPVVKYGRIPVEWETIAREVPEKKKTRITARFDADVVKFFRAAGQGYQSRMNRVLRAFMQTRLTGLVEGWESEEIVEKIRMYRRADVERPGLGDIRARIKKGVEDSKKW